MKAVQKVRCAPLAPPERPERRKKWTPGRILRWALLAYALYFILGATLPFLAHPEVSSQFQSAWDPAAFYQTGSSDRVGLVTDNQEALDLRLQIIDEARERILFSSFDIRPSESGRDICAALLAAAERGVEIQILWDGVSGVRYSGDSLFRALGRLPNVEIRLYNTPNPLLPWTVNGRLHDKYILVDDRLLLLGGRNTFDLFLGDYVPDAEKSHDQDVLVCNTAAGTADSGGHTMLPQVEDYFYSIWDSPHAKTVSDQQPLFPGGTERAAQALRTRYLALDRAEPWDYTARTVPVEHVALLHNPTGILSKEPWVWWQMMALMEGAGERAFLQTPYAVLNAPMYEALARIADKDISFDLQVNSVAVGDNIMASSDYVHNRSAILDTGVTLWEWFGDYSSHGKSALIDGDLALVGSYNLDMRSTYLDTELMLAIHSEAFTGLLEEHLNATQTQSLRVHRDGYASKAGVTPLEPTGVKARLFPVTSVVFQLIRYLL